MPGRADCGGIFSDGKSEIGKPKVRLPDAEAMLVNERIKRLSLKFFDFTALPLLQQTYKQGS